MATRKKQSKPALSAYILTTNNEETIKRCLDSLSSVEQVLIIDGGSTDRTLEYASHYRNVKIYRNPWPGYAAQRNFAFTKVESEWVIFVDSDMEVPAELLTEIREVIRKPKYQGYLVSYYNIFLGSYPLLGGDWFPCYADLLVNMSVKPHYDEKKPVHEGFCYQGKWGHLKNFIIHHNYPTVGEWIEKMNKYTDLEVPRLENTKLIWGRFNLRVRPTKSFSVIKFLLWYPLVYFVWVFIWKKGYRSGIPGIVYSLFGTFYVFAAHTKYWDYLCTVQDIKPSLKQTIEFGFKNKNKFLRK